MPNFDASTPSPARLALQPEPIDRNVKSTSTVNVFPTCPAMPSDEDSEPASSSPTMPSTQDIPSDFFDDTSDTESEDSPSPNPTSSAPSPSPNDPALDLSEFFNSFLLITNPRRSPSPAPIRMADPLKFPNQIPTDGHYSPSQIRHRLHKEYLMKVTGMRDQFKAILDTDFSRHYGITAQYQGLMERIEVWIEHTTRIVEDGERQFTFSRLASDIGYELKANFKGISTTISPAFNLLGVAISDGMMFGPAVHLWGFGRNPTGSSSSKGGTAIEYAHDNLRETNVGIDDIHKALPTDCPFASMQTNEGTNPSNFKELQRRPRQNAVPGTHGAFHTYQTRSKLSVFHPTGNVRRQISSKRTEFSPDGYQGQVNKGHKGSS
ncbi:hypothetical protein BJ508DRAFT_311836 [Ascobolus immersus RN42]|uniref:Uncharacterized protein n=1 Tax=Ascobolus immersus RN42 TaxID=1160509 RepID=A0A3N4HUX8_ASCIM|nr:hypothetical protein BJ508DRAFT_311836 [Ascobolus immersus RN42]